MRVCREEASQWTPMVVSLLKRIALMATTILMASTAVFALIHLSGDPVDGFLAPGAAPETREAARERLGLNEPMAKQYVAFIGRTMRGDFGDSWRNRQPALESVLERVPATLLLAAAAITVSAVLGVTVGLLSVWTGSRVLRSGVKFFGLLGQAIPAFWLGTIAIMVFAVNLGWLPPSGNDDWRSVVLPAVTLSAYPGSLIARMVQASLLETASRPYITSAHAKGLGTSTVWIRHALPNALIPTLAIIGLQAGFLAGGAIVVESVFAYPGAGRLALQAASDRDLPVVQAFVVVTIVLVSLTNIAIDLLAAWIDPAQRSRGGLAVFHG